MEEERKNALEMDQEAQEAHAKSAEAQGRRALSHIGDLMTRSMVKNISAWVRSSFWDKIFVRKPESYVRKVKTPKSYYRGKARQQADSQNSKKR